VIRIALFPNSTIINASQNVQLVLQMLQVCVSSANLRVKLASEMPSSAISVTRPQGNYSLLVATAIIFALQAM
jgi:hypothetical protein